MNLHFDPVTAQNRADVEALRLLPEQEHFIETVAQCMSEADEYDNWRPVGIYDGDELVGFAMYGFFQFEGRAGRAWLDRFLIDRKHQKKGYGKAAVQLLLDRLCREYNVQEIYLSVYDVNQPAIHLYTELGFGFNGELDINGEKVMVYHRA